MPGPPAQPPLPGQRQPGTPPRPWPRGGGISTGLVQPGQPNGIAVEVGSNVELVTGVGGPPKFPGPSDAGGGKGGNGSGLPVGSGTGGGIGKGSGGNVGAGYAEVPKGDGGILIIGISGYKDTGSPGEGKGGDVPDYPLGDPFSQKGSGGPYATPTLITEGPGKAAGLAKQAGPEASFGNPKWRFDPFSWEWLDITRGDSKPDGPPLVGTGSFRFKDRPGSKKPGPKPTVEPRKGKPPAEPPAPDPGLNQPWNGDGGIDILPDNDCDVCPIAPRRWAVTVSGVTDDICDDCTAKLNGTHILTYDGIGCGWSKAQDYCGEDTGRVMGLSYVVEASEWGFAFSSNSGQSPVWVLPVDEFDCLGTNILTIDPDSLTFDCGWPDTITVEPVP